jgi:hypothetical protein
MAIVITKSTLVQNFEAKPNQFNPAALLYGRRRGIVGTVAVAASDDDGSTYVLAPVRSSWVIPSIRLYNDAITGGTGYDVGLYESGLTAVDDDAYASAVSMATLSTEGVERAFEARNITAIGQKVWQDAGQTADPMVWYYLVLTADTVGTVAGDIAFDVTVLVD